jgi:putative membrane protein
MRRLAAIGFAIGMSTLAVGCASQPGGINTTTSTTTTTSGGDVDLGASDAPIASLTAQDVAAMSSANMIAHVALADSVEVVFAAQGAMHARDTAVRAFANRMVSEHGDHLKSVMAYIGLTILPASPSTSDSVGSVSASQMLDRLSVDTASADFDRRFMTSEVAMHEQLLRNLTMMQSRAEPTARQLIDQTIPIVREHLGDARRISKQLDVGAGS